MIEPAVLLVGGIAIGSNSNSNIYIPAIGGGCLSDSSSVIQPAVVFALSSTSGVIQPAVVEVIDTKLLLR